MLEEQSKNPFFTDLDYQDYCLNVFKDEYSSWSNLSILSREGNWYTFKKFKYSIQSALSNYMSRCEVFAASPASCGTTHMAWFDLDSHCDDVDKQKEALHITKMIYQYLTLNNVYPEFVQSSTVGNYHLRIRFAEAQSNDFLTVIQKGILRVLELPRSIEFGPKNRRQIRPWFVGNHFKPAGRILHKGELCKNIKCLSHLFKVGDEIKNEHFCENESDFKIDKYIPDGLYLKRNCALMHLVEDCVRFGYSKERILDHAKEIYARGVVKDSLDKHLLSFEAMYNYYHSRFGFWDTFWKVYPKGKTVVELLNDMRKYAKQHNLTDFPLSARVVAKYQGVSVRTAWKRLKALETYNTNWTQLGSLPCTSATITASLPTAVSNITLSFEPLVAKRGNRFRSTRYNVF